MQTLAVVLFLEYLFLNAWLLVRTRSASLLVLQLITYFYCFHAYFLAMGYMAGMEGGLKYILSYPYFVHPNGNFWFSLAIYGVYGIVYTGALLLLAPRIQGKDSIRLGARKLLFLGLVTGGIGLAVWYDVIRSAIESGVSAYLLFKGGEAAGRYGAIVSTSLNLSAITMALLSYGLMTGGKVGRVHIDYPRSFFGKMFTAPLIIGFTVLLAISLFTLGDKVLLVSAVLFCFMLVGRLNWLGVVLALAVVVSINTISIARHLDSDTGWPLSQLLLGSALHLLEHGETVTTFSLYAFLESGRPLTMGSSLVQLFMGLMPGFIVDKTQGGGSNYAEFASAIGVSSDETGWGMSYASDWFINFGLTGVIAGALLVGLFHGYLYRAAQRSTTWLIVFASVVAQWPLAIRSGIAVNGTIYAIAMGLLILVWAHRRVPSGFTQRNLILS